MKTKKWRFNRGNLPFALLLLMILVTTTGCRDLLEEKDPGWLGASIFDNLKRDGNYENVTKLIEDMKYETVLAKTGSKTLFVADDDAYNAFYANNRWGVTKYDDLSQAQKKILLFGAMINNSYPLNMLSSSAGPVLGNCMRRLTAMSLFDSVPYIEPAEMPNTKYWRFMKDNNRTIVCMKDDSPQPIIQFIEKQLNKNNVTNDDVNFLMNYTINRQPGDASINGIPVTKVDANGNDGRNIKCSNGFVHKLDSVLTPLNNMAEVIRTNPTTQIYSRLLERFSVPQVINTALNEYNRINNGLKPVADTIYKKRYFALRSAMGALETDPIYRQVAPVKLKFDPGWSVYYPLKTSANATAYQQDMGVMLVPSDSAMRIFFGDIVSDGNQSTGRILTESFRPSDWSDLSDYSWVDNIPNDIVEKLINNNMLNSFLSSLPSKFNSILDDASYDMGIKVQDVDKVHLACNGAIYETNKVFGPTSFKSVYFPAMGSDSLRIVNWAINQMQYYAYLNSMENTFSFFIPTDLALQKYIDPVSYGYGEGKERVLKFYFNPNAEMEQEQVVASVWGVNEEGVYDSIPDYFVGYSVAKNRLEDVLENHTVVGDVSDGNNYYRTKGGTMIKVNNPTALQNGMTVFGSTQIDSANGGIPVSDVYHQGNGKTYILSKEPIMTTRKSVYDILMEDSLKFGKFADLLMGSGFLSSKQNNHANASGHNIGFFSRYHYTVFAPTNEAIQNLQDSQLLPSWEQVDSLFMSADSFGIREDSILAEKKTMIIRNFVKYHIMDNAVFADTYAPSGTFETAMMDEVNSVFYSLEVTGGNNDLKVSYKSNVGANLVTVTRNLTKNPKSFNLIAREYMYNSSDPLANNYVNNIFSSANVVVHQLDGALLYDEKNQFNPDNY